MFIYRTSFRGSNRFFGITNPSQELNDGAFRPLEIITDTGSIFSAQKPAPVSVYFESMNPAADLIWKALAPILPHRLTAGHLLSMCSLTLWGEHHETGEPFLLVEPSFGGWGAGRGQDGARGLINIGDGETYNMPVEVAENRYGVLVEEYSLRCDGAGAGEFIGGSGLIRSYRVMTDNQKITATFGRNKYLPWGLKGGYDGSSNEFFIEKSNGKVDGPFGFYASYPLKKGDVVKLLTATGGGYGNPLNRPIEKVVTDVKNGYISFEQAEKIFGVVINKDTLEVVKITDQRKLKQKNRKFHE